MTKPGVIDASAKSGQVDGVIRQVDRLFQAIEDWRDVMEVDARSAKFQNIRALTAVLHNDADELASTGDLAAEAELVAPSIVTEEIDGQGVIDVHMAPFSLVGS
ncbi:hypothetical protein [Mycobacterium bourgelatii]|uniref:hypothetical protein n=1 Tax=Mycobacterium bourgelatii TaxID=1273442 RepID=UPI00196550A8|nr:hypothetical protein [Mycobacterium bourgelatii]MCV6974883.1 hypothetical protein [Mycobacterium bourgelatii]